MNDFIELIKLVGVPMAIGIIISVLIGKYVIENRINKLLLNERLDFEKKLELFKSELNKENLVLNQKFAIELEKIKSELNSNFEMKEYKTITLLSEKIFRFNDLISEYLKKIVIYNYIFRKNEPVFLNKINEDINDLRKSFNENKVYLSYELEKITEQTIEHLTYYGEMLNFLKVTYKDFDKNTDEQKREIYNNFINIELKDFLAVNNNKLKKFKEFLSSRMEK